MEYKNTDVTLRKYLSVVENDFDNLPDNAKHDVFNSSIKKRLEHIVKNFSRSIDKTFDNNLILMKYECDLTYLEKYGLVRKIICEIYNIKDEKIQTLKIVDTSCLVFPFKNDMIDDLKREFNNLEILRKVCFTCPSAQMITSSCGNYSFLLMDKIDGITIDKIWSFISSDKRESIKNKIDLYMDDINKHVEIGECELTLSNFVYNKSKIVGFVDWGILRFNAICENFSSLSLRDDCKHYQENNNI